MLCQPSIHQPGLVCRLTIHFPPGLPRQSQETTEEIHKHLCGEALTENHEGQPAPIGDRRDHVAPETLTGAYLIPSQLIKPDDGKRETTMRSVHAFRPQTESAALLDSLAKAPKNGSLNIVEFLQDRRADASSRMPQRTVESPTGIDHRTPN